MQQLRLVIFFLSVTVSPVLWSIGSSPCKTFEQQGDSSKTKGSIDKAIEFYKKGLSCAGTNGANSERIAILIKIGNSLAGINDRVKAMEYFLNALDLAEKEQLDSYKVDAYLGIASLKMNAYNNEEAITYLSKIKVLYAKNSSLPISSKKEYLQLLGVANAGIGKLDKALFYFQACEQLYLRSEKDANYGGILNNIGAIYSKRNDLNMASSYYSKALSYFKSSKNKMGVAVTQCNIAFIHQKKKEYQRAIDLYSVAIQEFKTQKAYFYLSNNYLNLTDIYKALGNYKKALDYFELSVKYTELNNNENEDALIDDLEMQYAIQKKNQEIKIIEQENELRRNRQRLTIILLISALGFIILVYINLRNRMQKIQLKKELAEKESAQLSQDILLKEKDLEILALKIIEKNQFLNKVKVDLTETQDAHSNNAAKINAIKQDILHNINIDKERLEFEMQIDQLQSSFISKLELHHENLTKTEKRLCSLLLMDLSSKDMATVMNITEDSIKKSRNRLRKKLGLENGANLLDYLKSL